MLYLQPIFASVLIKHWLIFSHRESFNRDINLATEDLSASPAERLARLLGSYALGRSTLQLTLAVQFTVVTVITLRACALLVAGLRLSHVSLTMMPANKIDLPLALFTVTDRPFGGSSALRLAESQNHVALNFQLTSDLKRPYARLSLVFAGAQGPNSSVNSSGETPPYVSLELPVHPLRKRSPQVVQVLLNARLKLT